MSHATNAQIEALTPLGLTPLEAQAYAFLLGESPATGYRIAQGLGKSIGNTYKVIESLEAKGAVVTSEDGGSRVVRATALAEFVAARRAELERAAGAARRVLSEGAAPDEPDELVYALHTPGQTIERARAMLRDATDFVICTATPALVPMLTDALERAAARAVHVAVKVFEPTQIRGALVAVDHRGGSAVETGPGQWLAMTVDGREMVHAIFSDDLTAVHNAVHTSNALLNWSFYTGTSSNFALNWLRQAARADEDGVLTTRLESVLEPLAPFRTPRSAGKRTLLARVRRPSPQARRQRSRGA